MNLFLSSDGTRNLSTTVKGMLVGLVPVAIAIGQVYGYDFTETQILEWIQGVTTMVSAMVIIGGLFKKTYHWINGTGAYAE